MGKLWDWIKNNAPSLPGMPGLPKLPGAPGAPTQPGGISLPKPPAAPGVPPAFPEPPEEITTLKPLVSNDERFRIFGKFDYVSAPTSNNPERIRFTDGWDKKNIIWVPVPQLSGLRGVEYRGEEAGMDFHRLGAAQLQSLWNEWEEAGLLNRVLTFEGSFNPRFVRGSRTSLSNHCFGNAFDINYEWNQLGAEPARLGRKGSVRELVASATRWGFFWGGNYKGRPDGMHFELAKVFK